VFDVGAGEMLTLLVVALLLFGPERLPKLAADAGRLIRELRKMAQGAKSQLGPEFEDINLADLNPRTFVTKHLLDGEEFSFDGEPSPRAGAPGPEPADRPREVRTPQPPVPPGQPAPYDPDAT
jgi:sec-independent protein translocase protein TatB